MIEQFDVLSMALLLTIKSITDRMWLLYMKCILKYSQPIPLPKILNNSTSEYTYIFLIPSCSGQQATPCI